MNDDDTPDELKAVTESAKAVQAVAKTADKSIDAGRELGKFVARFIGGPLEQASGIAEDKLKYMRWERQVRLMRRADEFLQQHGLDEPTRPIPMKVAVPLFQAASMEEDDELQDAWARLIANAADADSGVEVTRSLVTILEDFNTMDARVLNAIYAAPSDVQIDRGVATHLLPEAYSDINRSQFASPPHDDVQIAIWNLIRLGCVVSDVTDSIGIGWVKITKLGEKLVEACTLRENRE